MRSTTVHAFLVTVILLYGYLAKLPGQGPDNIAGFFPVEESFPFNAEIFQSDEIIEITLKYDITRFMDEKPEEEYLDAELSVHFGRKDSITKNIRLRCRGDYRYRTCPFPPIRFNFRESDIEDEEMKKVDNMKIVTHCRDDEKYTYYLLKEYLVYRIYNIITDYSFRVRMMKIRYVDTGDRKISMNKWAFIIEPVKMFESRTNCNEIESVEISYEDVEDGFADRVAMFEFMIGNQDWFIPLIHNFKLFVREGENGSGIIPVPYDFDYSGFVNAEYSTPRAELNLETIRDRAYLGPCRDTEIYRQVTDEYYQHKKEILKLVSQFKILYFEERMDVRLYLKKFYSLYRKDEIIRIMNLNCEELK